MLNVTMPNIAVIELIPNHIKRSVATAIVRMCG